LGLVTDGREVAFSTRSGILKAVRNGDRIELDFPLKPEMKAEPPAGLLEALGTTAKYVGKNQFDYLVEVESEAVVRSLTPDFQRLKRVECRGTIVTARSAAPAFDFVSRFFAPSAGIDEDPVTGSAHCCLADFWSRRLGIAKMTGYQASARGGTVHVEVKGDRAILAGQAVIVARGELLVD
jgi:predicted PhzF superfamily epimerase YddE/YHI9